MTWQDRAACNAHPEFLDLAPSEAKAFCARQCWVINECAKAALEEERDLPSRQFMATVRGGLTVAERDAMRRARKRTGAAA